MFLHSHKSFICSFLELRMSNSHRLPRLLLVFNLWPGCLLCFFCRAGSDEIDGQKAGEDGHHAGGPEAAHPAAGPAAPRPGGGPDPATPHTRLGCVPPAQSTHTTCIKRPAVVSLRRAYSQPSLSLLTQTRKHSRCWGCVLYLVSLPGKDCA